jgi:hypothetical protein
MRILTLHEKITVKGELARYRVPARHLLTLTTSAALELYWRCTGRPLAMLGSPKRWRKHQKRN